MSVRFDASGDFLFYSAGLGLDPNSPYSISVWVYLDSFANGDDTGIFQFRRLGGSTAHLDSVAYSQSLAKTQLRTIVNSTGTIASGSTGISTGAWRHLAMVRESTTSLKLYVDGALDATNTTDVSSRLFNTPTYYLGISAGAGNRMDGKMFGVKLWNSALTAAEVENEIAIVRPARLANLWAWYPLLTHGDLVDYSGNGRDLTAGGTLTTENNPPVGWGG